MSDRTDRPKPAMPGVRLAAADAHDDIQRVPRLERLDLSDARLRRYPDLMKALAMVAAVSSNADCAALDPSILSETEGGCRGIIDGKLHDQLDRNLLRRGGGSSLNINANEVIGSHPLEWTGPRLGHDHYGDPRRVVDARWPTDDADSTALRVGMALGNLRLIAAMNGLIETYRATVMAVRFSNCGCPGCRTPQGR